MGSTRWTTEDFEEHRPHLRGVAYRMLGSVAEAEDAVQEAWLRLDRADTDEVENLGGWLTTVVSRICLNQLRSRSRRREDAAGVHVPDPVIEPLDAVGPEHDALVAESVGMALLVVLETLTPAERVAFVLHDVFALPFDEIADLVDRTPEATRQLASRARRRVQDGAVEADTDLARQHEVVDAFFAAARGGDLEGLVSLLDPDVVGRTALVHGRSRVVRGAEQVARSASAAANPKGELQHVLVNGGAGTIIRLGGRPVALLAFTIRGGRIAAIDGINDPARLALLDLPSPS
jgi:RNA polymerase sigma factor (sigma-70 family)